MENKTLFFFIIFPLVFLITSCSSNQSKAIERALSETVLITDSALRLRDLTEAALYISNNMQKVDIRNCPQNFRVEYQKEINDWRQAHAALARNSSSFRGGGFYDIFSNEFKQHNDKRRTYINNQLKSMYDKLFILAASHGAKVSVTPKYLKF